MKKTTKQLTLEEAYHTVGQQTKQPQTNQDDEAIQKQEEVLVK